MNVSWTANYPTVNLWLIIDLQWNYPVSIVCEYMSARTKVVVLEATDDASSKLCGDLIPMDNHL